MKLKNEMKYGIFCLILTLSRSFIHCLFDGLIDLCCTRVGSIPANGGEYQEMIDSSFDNT